MKSTRLAGIVMLVGVGAGLGACGSSPTARSNDSPASETMIVIRNFGYSPADLSVKAGSTVAVRNDDDSTHTVTADNGAFKTDNIAPGQTTTFVAPAPGHYAYHCAIHNFMHGSLTVTG